jgi:MYXO-CTERM domain-containing protein
MTRFTPVDAVTRLREAGITVHVVGFGAAVDSLTLNRAAVAAGTALPGCDPMLSDPAAPNHCYSQADDMIALRDALDAIARDITDEVCDGFDNDCDGTVDEGFDADGDGARTCDGDCDDADAAIHPGAEELCDRLDNDCDGAADFACECDAGDTRPCGMEMGLCAAGTQTCGAAGTWGGCVGEVTPTGEVCNNEDEDCDGNVDEDTDCGEFGTCVDGGCVDLTPPMMETPMEPVPEDEPLPVAPPLEPGCGCVAAGTSSTHGSTTPLALLGAALALGFAARRRRR